MTLAIIQEEKFKNMNEVSGSEDMEKENLKQWQCG